MNKKVQNQTKQQMKIVDKDFKCPQKKPRGSNMYFNEETQKSIVKYQAAETREEKDKIYIEEIRPAFEKLVENLINIYGFVALHDSYAILRADCLSFLFETLDKFDVTRGFKAFSYFNVVAKNWLVVRQKIRVQHTKKIVSLDDKDSMTTDDERIIKEYHEVPAQDTITKTTDLTYDVLARLKEIKEMCVVPNELLVTNAIITIFENVNDVDIISKNAIMLYMREMTGLSAKQLTTTMQAIRRYYSELVDDEEDMFL